MALQLRKCLACGAPLQGLVCAYCKAVHEDSDAKVEEIPVYVNNMVYMTIPKNIYTANELRKMTGLTEEQATVAECPIRNQPKLKKGD